MKLEKLLLDEGRKEARERALGHKLEDSEHGLDEPEDLKLPDILTDPRKEKLFGELMDSMYPDEADGIFERLGNEQVTVDDLAKLNSARHDFSLKMAEAKRLGAGVDADDVALTSHHSEEFQKFSSLVKEDKRTAELIQDHFYRVVMRGDTDTIDRLKEAQQKLREVKSSTEYKKVAALATKLKDTYGFEDKQYSILEEGYYTLQERKKLKGEIYRNFSGFMKTMNFLDNVFTLGMTSPASRRANRQIRTDFKETKGMISKHFKEKGYGGIRSYFKSIGALATVKMIEDAETPEGLKQHFEAIGGILAASLSKDDRVVQALAKEAQGGPKAEIIDNRPPKTWVDVQGERKQLTEGQAIEDLKKYLKRRKAEDPGFNPQTADRGSIVNEFIADKKSAYEKRLPSEGFFVRILMRLFGNFSNNIGPKLQQANVWT
jgi:hypothetical protein